MPNFAKVSVYNRYDHKTIVPAYLNIDQITSLTEFVDTRCGDETWYMVYLTEGSYRVPKKTYDYLVYLVYGKEYSNEEKTV